MSEARKRRRNIPASDINIEVPKSKKGSKVEQGSTGTQKALKPSKNSSAKENDDPMSSQRIVSTRSKRSDVKKSVNSSTQVDVGDEDKLKKKTSRERKVNKADPTDNNKTTKELKKVPSRSIAHLKSVNSKKDVSTQFPEIITIDDSPTIGSFIQEPSTSNNIESTLVTGGKVKADGAPKHSTIKTGSKANKNNHLSSNDEEPMKTNRATAKSKNHIGKSKTDISNDKCNATLIGDNNSKDRKESKHQSLFDSPKIAVIKQELHTPQSPIASISKHNVWAAGSPNTSKNNQTSTKNIPKQLKPSIKKPTEQPQSNLLNTDETKNDGKLMTTRTKGDSGSSSEGKRGVQTGKKNEAKSSDKTNEKLKKEQKLNKQSKRHQKKQDKLAKNFGKFAEYVCNAVATGPTATNPPGSLLSSLKPINGRLSLKQTLDLLADTDDSEHSTDCSCSSCTSYDSSSDHSSSCSCSSCVHFDDSSSSDHSTSDDDDC